MKSFKHASLFFLLMQSSTLTCTSMWLMREPERRFQLSSSKRWISVTETKREACFRRFVRFPGKNVAAAGRFVGNSWLKTTDTWVVCESVARQTGAPDVRKRAVSPGLTKAMSPSLASRQHVGAFCCCSGFFVLSAGFRQILNVCAYFCT